MATTFLSSSFLPYFHHISFSDLLILLHLPFRIFPSHYLFEYPLLPVCILSFSLIFIPLAHSRISILINSFLYHLFFRIHSFSSIFSSFLAFSPSFLNHPTCLLNHRSWSLGLLFDVSIFECLYTCNCDCVFLCMFFVSVYGESWREVA